MWLRNSVTLGLLLALSAVCVGDLSGDDASASAERYQRLVAEYEAGREPRELAERFFELAEQFPKDPAAVDALDWVLKKLRNRPEAERALERLAKNHLESERLAAAFPQVARTSSLTAEKLLRSALEKSPHFEVRAQACLHLALLLDQQATVLQQLKKQPESADRVLEYYGQQYGRHLASLDPKQLDRNREQVYERMLKSFADVMSRDGTLGQLAEKQLFQIRYLSIGRVAPEIQGQDIFGKEFKLSQYRGKVVMLSFWGHWWGPCRELYPHERSLVKRLADQPFALLGINSDSDREELKKTLQEEQITWRSWWDEGSSNGPIQTRWNVTLRPTIFVLDGDGVIRYKDVMDQALDEAIAALLKELADRPENKARAGKK